MNNAKILDEVDKTINEKKMIIIYQDNTCTISRQNGGIHTQNFETPHTKIHNSSKSFVFWNDN